MRKRPVSAPATACLAATDTLQNLALNYGGCAVTMTVNDVVTGNTPPVIGVNMGHHHPDDASWVTFMKRLGVNGAPPRMRACARRFVQHATTDSRHACASRAQARATSAWAAWAWPTAA